MAMTLNYFPGIPVTTYTGTDGENTWPAYSHEQVLDAYKAGLSAQAKVRPSAEDRYETYVAALIDANPDVQKLGERLALWLDEDKFNTIEPILLGIAARLSQGAQGEAKCHRCWATSHVQAETMCIPDGDSCPGCEKPLSDQWKAERAAVPDGWVLVPREPTPEMLAVMEGMEISVRVAEDDTAEYPVPEDDCAEIYRAMIAAAPQSPEGARVVDGLTAQTFGEWCNTLTHAHMYITEREPANAQYGIEKVLNELRAWQRKLAAPTLAGKDG